MTIDQDLAAVAEEELVQALAMEWRQLAPLAPWGDTFTGLSPANRSVQISRGYLWAAGPGGDLLCEVRVYLDEARHADGVRLSALIRRPG